jgi:hypothetical protein
LSKKTDPTKEHEKKRNRNNCRQGQISIIAQPFLTFNVSSLQNEDDLLF